jgi:hypothetical protein
MPVANRLYAVAASPDDWRVLAKSIDEGQSWQQLEGDRLDTLVREEATFLSSVETGTDTLLFSDDALVRQDAQGEWIEVQPSPPAAITAPSASGSLVAYMGRQDSSTGLALSTDGGASWTMKNGDPEYRFANVRAWKGKLLAHDYSTLRVSDNEGEQWQVVADGPPLDFSRWAFTSDTIVVHEAGTDTSQMLHVSTDGLSWESHRLADELPAIERLFGIDDRLIALTADGTVAELFIDGSSSPLSAPPDTGGRFRRAVATDRGFVALQAGAMLRWNLADGWGESLVERGLNTGTAIADHHMTWVVAANTFFRLQDEQWSRVPSLFEAPSLIGAVDDTLLVAGASHCVYRYDGGDWRFVAQWREDDTVNTSQCDSSQRPDGRLLGPVVWNGRVLLGRDTSPGELADTAGDVVELSEAVPPEDIEVSNGHLWIVSEGRLYRGNDDAMTDRTADISELAGTPQEILRVWGSSQSTLVESTREATPRKRRIFLNRADTWQEIPVPASESPLHVVGVNERGIFGLNDGQVWLYEHAEEQWRQLDEGLPGQAGVHSVSVATTYLAATLDSGGLWKLGPFEPPTR